MYNTHTTMRSKLDSSFCEFEVQKKNWTFSEKNALFI